MSFNTDFKCFLNANGVVFDNPAQNIFIFNDFNLKIELVELISGEFHTPVPELDTIYLFEDRWIAERNLTERRILAHLGRYRAIFARKCTVRRIDAPTAGHFLDLNHSYKRARAKFKYGLFYRDELVAVSCFSSARNIHRIIGDTERTVRSYEWVRYAGLPDCRISGGMGKMLQAFIEDIHPEEVMSYADLEWSQGKVYSKLGFKDAGFRAPVKFWLDPVTYERLREPKESATEFQNLGSRKYLLRI